MKDWLDALVPKASAAEFSFTQSMYDAIGWNSNKTGEMTVASFINPILNVLYGLAALILLINIILAGLKISVKEKKGLEEAKKSLMNSIIGLVIVIFATLITNILAGFFT